MTRRTAASLTPTASIPPLSPEDRVSNFSVPPSSAGGDYDGGHALLEWALPVEVVDADARFAEWFFGEVTGLYGADKQRSAST